MTDTVDAEALAEVRAGLLADPKRLSPKFFYDALGSKLFEAITVTPEYYPTGCELEILRGQGESLAAALGPGVSLVELGTGSFHKVDVLLSALDRPRAYVPIDISAAALDEAALHVSRAFPELAVRGVVGDFTQPRTLPPRDGDGRWVVFYPGSTLGNFDPVTAEAFLSDLADWLRPGDGLLLGVDLVKDAAVLERAYNDRAGVTAAFNRNMLLHLNRRVGADFDVDRFEHEAFWNRGESRVEMHLRSVADQTVTLGDGTAVHFGVGETLHTESSYKYEPPILEAMATRAGFQPRSRWLDGRSWFGVWWLERP